jgi:hypothetical protein
MQLAIVEGMVADAAMATEQDEKQGAPGHSVYKVYAAQDGSG